LTAFGASHTGRDVLGLGRLVRSPTVATRLNRYVALFRAVNLGPRNKVSMADLRALFADLGAEDVTTYVQSGNVVFRSAAGDPEQLVGAIEERVKRDLGLDVRVLLRTRAQLAKLQSGNPFLRSGIEPSKLHVTFLAETPARAAVCSLDPQVGNPDEFRVVGREVYTHYPNGYGRTKLSNTYFEKQLGVVATTRSWNTVSKLAELAGA